MTDRPRYLERPDKPLRLDFDRRYPRHHVFDDIDIDAVNTALAVGRPLLVRGEPGAGKSQLALAAAIGLGRAFVKEVVDARTESRDLLWRFDAVRRLADAQVANAATQEHQEKWKDDHDPLDEIFYMRPGVLWWGLAWSKAADQAEIARTGIPRVDDRCDPANGVVVLLDEIDKADSSVPNGLLGVLGDGELTVPGVGDVRLEGPPPLVVITTNEERALPDAFLRRCVVHEMKLDRDEGKLRNWLVNRGRAHFGDLSADVLTKAADLLIQDRKHYRQRSLTPPGAAEYLDLLRAVAERGDSDQESRTLDDLLEDAGRFILKKHPAEG